MTQVQIAQRPLTGSLVRPSQVCAPRGLEGMRLTRRGRVVLWAGGFVLAVVITLLGVGAGADGSPQAVEVSRHAVVPGDTVWSLAAGLNPGLDIRDVVDEVLALNGRTSTVLYAGETILLPRY